MTDRFFCTNRSRWMLQSVCADTCDLRIICKLIQVRHVKPKRKSPERKTAKEPAIKPAKRKTIDTADILRQLAQGHSVQRIAFTFGCTVRTVFRRIKRAKEVSHGQV
jgi:DNA-binding NarL/FixJ family response regulator